MDRIKYIGFDMDHTLVGITNNTLYSLLLSNSCCVLCCVLCCVGVLFWEYSFPRTVAISIRSTPVSMLACGQLKLYIIIIFITSVLLL